VTSRDDRVAVLPVVVLAQKDRACISDHFHLCLGHVASVTGDPDAHAHDEIVGLPDRVGDALRPGEIVAKNSHGQSFQG
jgi:hypothetical protein